MKTVRLGRTGLEVSRVGIGGIPLTRPSEAEAIRVIRRALDLGVNFIDTARRYWTSEERIGKALVGRRREVVLATKGGRPEHLDESLRTLGTDYVDLWQFHGVSSSEDLEAVLGSGLDLARKARQAGKALHIGITSHSLRIAREAVASGQFETVQFPFSFVENDAEEGLVPLAREHDVGFIAMKPFAGGRLRDAGLAIRYLLQFETVVPDPDVETEAVIEEIVRVVEARDYDLTAEEDEAIAMLRAQLGTRFCRQCEYCLPCPQGVCIPGLLYLPILWDLWPAERFFSWKYVADSVASAKACVECGACEKKCPYQLPIREMIKENVAFYERLPR